MFENKNYTYTKLNCLKFNSALNNPKKVDTPLNKTNQPTFRSNTLKKDMKPSQHSSLVWFFSLFNNRFILVFFFNAKAVHVEEH